MFTISGMGLSVQAKVIKVIIHMTELSNVITTLGTTVWYGGDGS